MSRMLQMREDRFVEQIKRLRESNPEMSFSRMYNVIPELSQAYSKYKFNKLLEKHNIIPKVSASEKANKERLRIWSKSPRLISHMITTLRLSRENNPKASLRDLVEVFKNPSAVEAYRKLAAECNTKMPTITENFLCIFLNNHCKGEVPKKLASPKRENIKERTTTSILREHAFEVFTAYEMFQGIGLNKGLKLNTYNLFVRELGDKFESIPAYGKFCHWLSDYEFDVKCHNEDFGTNLTPLQYAKEKSKISKLHEGDDFVKTIEG